MWPTRTPLKRSRPRQHPCARICRLRDQRMAATPCTRFVRRQEGRRCICRSTDSTTDADVAFAARSTDIAPAASPANAIAVLAERLRRLRLRFERELVRLNAIKGPESSLSLELLVAQICDMWSQETGRHITANPYRRYDYTGRPQTEAGRFVLQVVEALQPSKAWIGRHRAAASHKRAMIVMGARGFQAQADHTAMRKYMAAQKLAAGRVVRPKHTL